jgi:hypothetical protein
VLARAPLVLILVLAAQFPLLWSTAFLAGYGYFSPQFSAPARAMVTFAFSLFLYAVVFSRKGHFLGRILIAAIATSGLAFLISIAIWLIEPNNWARPFLKGFATAVPKSISPETLQELKDHAISSAADSEYVLPATILPSELLELRHMEKPVAILSQDHKEISVIWRSGLFAFGIHVGLHPPEVYSPLCSNIKWTNETSFFIRPGRP